MSTLGLAKGGEQGEGQLLTVHGGGGSHTFMPLHIPGFPWMPPAGQGKQEQQGKGACGGRPLVGRVQSTLLTSLDFNPCVMEAHRGTLRHDAF